MEEQSVLDKHLDFTQNIIERMAKNSFSIKTWTMVIWAGFALYVISIEGFDFGKFLFLIPIISFWFLDAYFLRQERIFRDIADGFKKLKLKDPKDFVYDIPKQLKTSKNKFFKVMFSITLNIFYISHIVFIIISSLTS